ncbi:MAG: hypothetical protein ACXVLQ_12430 [Bacteriovorax sp.]
MNFVRALLVSLFLVSTAKSFAGHTPDSPECKAWRQQLVEINQSIANSKEDLKTCQSTSDCHDIEVLIASLKSEKSGIENFLVNFCH